MLKAWLLLLALLTVATGCGRTLYHYHRTVVGVDISGNVAGESPSGHLTLGYSRRLVIIMPPEIEDAMRTKRAHEQQVSLPNTIFCTQVRASLGGVNAFREVLATGEPAVGFAEIQAAGRPSDKKARNFVCPGYEVPETGTTGVPGTARKVEPSPVPR